MKVAIIGGGASGFFAAIHVKINYPESSVIIFEKSKKILSKVKVSGGGRCNVTNGCTDIKILAENYPRGSKQLRKLFGFFSTSDTMKWFEDRGVALTIQEDNCVFPVSQNSQTIIDCFMNETRKLGIEIKMDSDVKFISRNVVENNLIAVFESGENLVFDKIIVTTGGQPKREKYNWLHEPGHAIVAPLPSLFTFNMPNEPIRDLMGIVVENAAVTIRSTKLKADGPLLVTHWGMSGPAILKLSAFGARILADMNYDFFVHVNWLNLQNEMEIKDKLSSLFNLNGYKHISNVRPLEIPQRLWEYLLKKIEIPLDKPANQINQKELNKLINLLSNDAYKVTGKTTFKEEFVTCGGISLGDISFKSMQSKKVKGLYFAGEVIDVDGVTGGYNFQAAWTTAFIAAKLFDE